MAIYVKPGVYSKYVRTAGSVKVSAGARIVALIGTAPTYFTINDEAVVRGAYPYSTSHDALENTATEIVQVGDYPRGSNYVEGVDYQLTTGKVNWIISGDAPNAGATYYVTYKYDKVSADYDPKLFVKPDDIENEYGKESITYTLTLGAKLAIENGANYIILCQVPDTTTESFTDVIDKLKYRIEGVDPTIIVALTTNVTVQAYLKSHVEFMSSQLQRKERYGIIGMAVGTSIADARAKAQGISYNRIIFPYDECVREIKDPDTNVVADHTLDGTFLGSAIAGLMTKYVVQEPLTRKVVNGFKSSTKTGSLLETEKDDLAGNGVLLLEEQGGIISVRHGMTTDTSTAEDNEISVMLIRDNTIYGVRTALDKLHIAKVSSTTTESDIKTNLESILKTFIEDGSITKFDNVTVTQNSIDKTRFDVKFRIAPAYPINYIYIEFTI